MLPADDIAASHLGLRADTGADLDFLLASSGSWVSRESH